MSKSKKNKGWIEEIAERWSKDAEAQHRAEFLSLENKADIVRATIQQVLKEDNPYGYISTDILAKCVVNDFAESADRTYYLATLRVFVHRLGNWRTTLDLPAVSESIGPIPAKVKLRAGALPVPAIDDSKLNDKVKEVVKLLGEIKTDFTNCEGVGYAKTVMDLLRQIAESAYGGHKEYYWSPDTWAGFRAIQDYAQAALQLLGIEIDYSDLDEEYGLEDDDDEEDEGEDEEGTEQDDE